MPSSRSTAALPGCWAERVGMRTGNLAVVMVENEREDWSFGRGQASYLELPRHFVFPASGCEPFPIASSRP